MRSDFIAIMEAFAWPIKIMSARLTSLLLVGTGQAIRNPAANGSQIGEH